MNQQIGIKWRIWLYVALIAIAIVIQQRNLERKQENEAVRRSLNRPMVVQFPPPDIEIPYTEKQLQRAIGDNPRDFGAHFYLMCLYAQQEKWSSSLKHALEARRIDPKDLNAHMGAAYSYANLGKLQQALETIDTALKQISIPEDRAPLRRIRGDILMEQYLSKSQARLLDQVLSAYRNALKDDPRNAQAQVGVARVEIERKQYDLARQRLQKVLDQVKLTEPGGRRKRALALYYLGLIEERQKRKEQARKLYDKARKMHPPSFVLKKELR